MLFACEVRFVEYDHWSSATELSALSRAISRCPPVWANHQAGGREHLEIRTARTLLSYVEILNFENSWTASLDCIRSVWLLEILEETLHRLPMPLSIRESLTRWQVLWTLAVEKNKSRKKKRNSMKVTFFCATKGVRQVASCSQMFGDALWDAN